MAARLRAALLVCAALFLAAAPACARDYPKIRGRQDYKQDVCFLMGEQSPDEWGGRERCYLDNNASKTVLLWGDSFGAHYIPGLDRSDWRKANIVEYVASGCPPVLGADFPARPLCDEFNDNAAAIIAQFNVSYVILAARWHLYWGKDIDAALLQKTIDGLVAQGRKVIVVGQSPIFEYDHPMEFMQRVGGVNAPAEDFSRLNARLAALSNVAAFFNPYDYLCKGLICPLKHEGRFLYYDWGHYSTYGSGVMTERLLSVVEDVMTRDAASPAGMR